MLHNFATEVDIYARHFPELARIVSSNDQYAKLVLAIGDKSRLTDDDLHELAAAVDDDEGIAQAIIKAARTSMGRDLSEADMEIVMAFAKRTASLAAYRRQLSNYMSGRMNQVAPNLAALIGDTVGARLISKVRRSAYKGHSYDQLLLLTIDLRPAV